MTLKIWTFKQYFTSKLEPQPLSHLFSISITCMTSDSWLNFIFKFCSSSMICEKRSASITTTSRPFMFIVVTSGCWMPPAISKLPSQPSRNDLFYSNTSQDGNMNTFNLVVLRMNRHHGRQTFGSTLSSVSHISKTER